MNTNIKWTEDTNISKELSFLPENDVCVTKDPETARSFNVSLQTMDGTTFGKN